MAEARKQGLWVNVEREGFVAEGPGSLFGYTEKNESFTSRNPSVSFSYCIFWKVYEPSSNSKKIIELGFEPIYDTKIDQKTTIGYSPTTTSESVESEIKQWLLEIFKKLT